MEPTALPDAEAREASRTRTDLSLIVEASAGTGKTTTLIARLLKLVLEDGSSLSRIAAVTFTEKAAGEMKRRLLSELSRAAEEPRHAARARRALFELPGAEIATIHAFCARLLRERPVEAGVDPDFVAPDESVAKDLVREGFDLWLDEEARRYGSPLVEALKVGVEPEAIRRLAEELYENRAVLESGTLPKDPVLELRKELASLDEELASLAGQIPDRRDPRAAQIAEARRELTHGFSLDFAGLSVWKPAVPFNLRKGGNTLDRDVRERLKEAVAEYRKLPTRLLGLSHEPLLVRLLESLQKGLFARLDEEKRRHGFLDFDDLLLLSRDLLRSSPAAREHFRDRFTTLIVDEFQDTDPVQAEIVRRLSSAEPQDEKRWDDLVPRPGALFLVGDPKQSIYRFRRADVETYGATRDRFKAHERLTLTTNFRSTETILQFVNRVTEPIFQAGPATPWDVSFAPLHPPKSVPSAVPPRVLYLAPPPLDELVAEAESEEGNADGAARGQDAEVLERLEAHAVANLIRERFANGRVPLSDIAVLVARNETIDTYQEVFRAAGISAALEGGQSFYRREETAAAIAALRCLDDPGDGVATVATLKSFLFAHDDRELLAAAEAGLRFDDWWTVPRDSPLFASFELLSELHQRRHERPVAETLGALFHRRAARLSLSTGAVVNGAQGLANLSRLLVFARALDAQGLSFREAVARLSRRLADSLAEPRAFEEDEAAVRLITVHKAKGLEFRVVILAGLGLKDPTRGKDRPLLYDRAGGEWAARLTLGKEAIKTPGFERLRRADDARLLAEGKRLLYVGMTRAKETLVLSWFRKRAPRVDGTISDRISSSVLGPIAFAETDSGILASLVEEVRADVRAPVGDADQEAGTASGIQSQAAGAVLPTWEDELAAIAALSLRARETASRALRRAGDQDRGDPADPGDRSGGEVEESQSPTASEAQAARLRVPRRRRIRPEDEAPEDRFVRAGERALRVGLAVHRLMERVLSNPVLRSAPPDDALATVLPELGLDEAWEVGGGTAEEREEAARLAGRLLRHPIVERARRAKRVFAEMPVLYVEDRGKPTAALVEGKIDLLFEEDDGFVIVDWKTDELDGPSRRASHEERYAGQLEAYGRALAAVLGPGAVLKEKTLVFARDEEDPSQASRPAATPPIPRAARAARPVRAVRQARVETATAELFSSDDESPKKEEGRVRRSSSNVRRPGTAGKPKTPPDQMGFDF